MEVRHLKGSFMTPKFINITIDKKEFVLTVALEKKAVATINPSFAAIVEYGDSVTNPKRTPSTLCLPSWTELMLNDRRPSHAMIERSVVSLPNGKRYRAISMQRPPKGLRGAVEVSSNLLDWYSGTNHTTTLWDTATALKVRDNIPFTPEQNRFIRFKDSSD